MVSPKDIVRDRSLGFCEKCGVKLLKNDYSAPVELTGRSVHHRRPRRHGGRDSVVNMVNICIGCHRIIHGDEKAARAEGWIVRSNPAVAPFASWRGWVLPLPDGSLLTLDFEHGRLLPPMGVDFR